MNEENELLEKIIQLNKNKEYEQVIRLLPIEVLEKYNNANLYAEKAMAFWNTQKDDECKKSAEKALELDSKNTLALQFLGNIAFKFKEYEKAKSFYLKAIEIDPKFAAPYIGLGNIYYELIEYKKAKDWFLKVIEIYPQFAIPYNGLGNVYLELKDYENAKDWFLKAIEIDSKFVYSYFGLGNVYFELTDYENAEKFYLKAIDIDPKFASPYSGLGNIQFKLKDYENAEKFYLKAIDIDPKNYDFYHNLSIVYELNNEHETARKYFKQFLSLHTNPKDIFYKSAVSKIKEIEKILEYPTYKEVNDIVDKIKNLLRYDGNSVTHYTSISTVQYLVLQESPLRISEGSFLNDTSEGQELFSFLDYISGENANKKCNKESFIKKPFIGSFVDAAKNNDLTLWRMYGKEKLEEAKGCSITINAKNLLSNIKTKIALNSNFPNSSFDENKFYDLPNSSFDEIEFYRVAYRNEDKFEFAGATDTQNKALSSLMQSLLDIINDFKQEKHIKQKEEVEVVELLNQIAFLFKSTEYKFENEIRLIIKDAIGFERKIGFDEKNLENFKPSLIPFKVYVELVPIHDILSKITIGPKVEKAEEWASTFYYKLAKKDLYPEIEISTLPFK